MNVSRCLQLTAPRAHVTFCLVMQEAVFAEIVSAVKYGFNNLSKTSKRSSRLELPESAPTGVTSLLVRQSFLEGPMVLRC